MHYKVAPGIIIKTENAAKPERQASSYLKALISNLPHVPASLDFGCGKLRYCNSILETTDTLAIVDSEIQLSRRQILRGSETSVRDLTRRSNRVEVYNDLEFQKTKRRFDRAFCINVLSVIPIAAKRRRILSAIRSHLRPKGSCLFVVQYRNSDFTRMQAMPNARPWSGGFLIDSLRGYSFYALISPERLARMVRRAGFSVVSRQRNEGSAYLWAERV